MVSHQTHKLLHLGVTTIFNCGLLKNGVIVSHLLMIIQSLAQMFSLTIVSNLGLEPWILLALRCFGGLVFISIISLFSLVREPLPSDKYAKILSYCHSLGQLSIMVLYILCGSVDDGINKDFVLITPALVTLGISYEYRDALLSSEKKDCARATIFIIFWSFIISVLYIFNFVQYENSWIVLTCLILCTTTFVSCKMIYYFSFLGIDKKKIKPLEISATSLFNISKIGIPAGILVHTWRMSRLLPTRDYKMFLLDLTKCDNRSALQIIISSIISFGVVIPIQAIAIPNISFLEYTLYSTFPSIVFSNNYARIGFAIAVVIALYKRQLAYKNIKEAEIHLVSIN